MSKKKVKGRTMELNDFLSEGGKPIQAGFTLLQRKIDWSADSSIVDVVLPTAPLSSRGGLVDDSKVPTEPPFRAFLGCVPFEATEEEVATLFSDLKLNEIRLVRDGADRPKGFGYADFEDRASLIAALNLDGEQFRNRQIKISLPVENEDGRDRRGGYGMSGSRGMPERDLPSDWRAAKRDDPAPASGGRDSGFSRGGDRDRYGDRDRDRDRGGFGGDRDRELNQNWRSGGGGGGGAGAGGGGGGFDRAGSGGGGGGGFGSRYEPPRDRGMYRSENNSSSAERPRLNLAPRTKPVEPIKVTTPEPDEEKPEKPRPKIEKPKSTDIFGAAKPVDTAAKEREIERRLEQQRAEGARGGDADNRDKENPNNNDDDHHANNNNNNNNDENDDTGRRGPNRDAPVKSWRDESREEREKRERERKARVERRIPAPQQLVEEEPVVLASKNQFADLDDTDGGATRSDGEES